MSAQFFFLLTFQGYYLEAVLKTPVDSCDNEETPVRLFSLDLRIRGRKTPDIVIIEKVRAMARRSSNLLEDRQSVLKAKAILLFDSAGRRPAATTRRVRGRERALKYV